MFIEDDLPGGGGHVPGGLGGNLYAVLVQCWWWWSNCVPETRPECYSREGVGSVLVKQINICMYKSISHCAGITCIPMEQVTWGPCMRPARSPTAASGVRGTGIHNSSFIFDVLVGNRWIREGGQMYNRPCGRFDMHWSGYWRHTMFADMDAHKQGWWGTWIPMEEKWNCYGFTRKSS